MARKVKKVLDILTNSCIIDHMKDKEENNLPPAELQAISTDYDTIWGVSGYYLDNDGNDIRDRD